MIVPMQQLTLFVRSAEQETALRKLRRLGVVHLKPIKPPISASITGLESRLNQTERALMILQSASEANQSSQKSDQKPAQLVPRIIDQNEKRSQLQEKRAEEMETVRWYQQWGRISRQDIDLLRTKGIYLRFYIADKQYLKKMPADQLIYVVNQTKANLYLVLVSQSEDARLDLKETRVPAKSYAQVQSDIKALQADIQEITAQLKAWATYLDLLQDYRGQLQKDLEFAYAKHSMEQAAEISYLEGFCPRDRINQVKKAADKEGWGYVIREPDDPHKVPTLLSDTRSKRLVDPIYKFMGTLPGYEEFDISTPFLIFFAIFVAMIVGDAGYGLVYLGLTFLARKKMPKAPQSPFTLFYILSITTIIWGILTGTYFGIEKLQEYKILNALIVDQIKTFSEGNTNFLMFLTFAVGGIQLSLAHLLRAWHLRRQLNALAEFGWILIVFAMLCVAEQIVLTGQILQGAVAGNQIVGAVLIGAIVVLVFQNYKKGHLLKGMLQTIGNLPMDIISAFSDIVSYIRLFAVGLATVVIETSFNEMAIGNGINGIIPAIVAVLVLLLGHGLNLILAVMSIVVHGIRLNMLEFSNHLGMTWSGTPYKPFKE